MQQPQLVADVESGAACVRVEIIDPWEVRFGNDIRIRTVLYLSPDLGMAPMRAECTQVIRQGDRFVERDMPQSFVARWSGFTLTPESGGWLPSKCVRTSHGAVLLPRKGDFAPLLENGKEVMLTTGAVRIAPASYFGQRYDEVEHAEWVVHEARVNQGLRAPLCDPLPAGCVVCDRTTKQVYQMVAEGTPADRAFQTILEGA